MRLGFYYHVPAFQTAESIFTPGFQGRFIDALARHCSEVVCFLHAPTKAEMQFQDYKIQSVNVSLVNIGLHTSVPQRVAFSSRYSASLKARRDKLDAVLLRGPSPLLPAMARAAQALPKVLLLVGRGTRGIDDLPQPWWRKEL